MTDEVAGCSTEAAKLSRMIDWQEIRGSSRTARRIGGKTVLVGTGAVPKNGERWWPYGGGH